MWSLLRAVDGMGCLIRPMREQGQASLTRTQPWGTELLVGTGYRD